MLPPFGVGTLPVWEIVDLALDANTIFDAIGQWTPNHHIRIPLPRGNPFSLPHVSVQIRFLGTPIWVQKVNWDINQLRSSCYLPQSSSRLIHKRLLVQIPLDVFAKAVDANIIRHCEHCSWIWPALSNNINMPIMYVIFERLEKLELH